MSTTPSSPFDDIMPWKGIRRVTDSNTGELVEIPKFYYKWTRDGAKMKLQISMGKFDGCYTSPAHADRGDGVGERDYVYVGRYHCASDYKSKTGVLPKNSITCADARSGIHNLNSNAWQYDYAMYWTIAMLYLVEYAHWDTSAKIGSGGIATSDNALLSTGQTDTMPYHTGTMYSARSTQGAKVQYRYIENLWANGMQFVDCIYVLNSSVYVNNNPSDYASTGSGTLVASNIPGFNQEWSYVTSAYSDQPSTSGLEYAIFTKSTINGYYSGYDTYTCNKYWNSSSSGIKAIFYYGGQYQNNGVFCNTLVDVILNNETTSGARSSPRLIVLPSQRIN